MSHVYDMDREAVSDEDLYELRKLPVASVQAFLPAWRVMHPGIAARTPGNVSAGRALTIQCSDDDNLALHAGLDTARANDMIVVAGTTGTWGGQATEFARAIGCSGSISGGYVRDRSVFRRLNYGVWSRGVSPRGATKGGAGTVNAPISVGGVVISAGDAILADDDGVCVIPPRQVWDICKAAAALESQEEEERPMLRAGESPFRMKGMDRLLEPGKLTRTNRLWRP